MSGASYILIMPSEDDVASTKPRFFGENLTSVTDVLESTKFVLLIQRFAGVELGVGFCSALSSHTEAVRSKDADAITLPNSGCAQLNRQIDPL